MADAFVDKVIITHSARLRAKYGASADDVFAACGRLVHADADRGVTCELVDLNDGDLLAALDSPPAGDGSNAMNVLGAVDGICDAVAPDYLVLLGGPDVIPHVDLVNPLAGGNDPDANVPSDLPYACNNVGGAEVSDYIGPMRVVGRIPDAPGASDAAALVALIDAACVWESREAQHHRSHLTISTATWKASTEESCDRLFGSVDVSFSPPGGPRWDDALLRPTHFLNLHGAAADFRFYGEDAASFPVALSADDFPVRLADGTICAAECCYGAELFDSDFTGGTDGLALTYLARGAVALMGSSTTSYGPPIGNGAADIICRYFLEEIFAGASTGRALLQARQRYIRDTPVMSPIDLKTLGQFLLLGDPSAHPVARQNPIVDTTSSSTDVTADGTAQPDAHLAKRLATRPLRAGRSLRRRNLESNGAHLALLTTTTRRVADTNDASADPQAMIAKVADLADVPEMSNVEVLHFQVREPELATLSRPKGAGAPPPPDAATMKVVVARADEGSTSSPGPHLVAVIATEQDDEIVAHETMLSR